MLTRDFLMGYPQVLDALPGFCDGEPRKPDLYTPPRERMKGKTEFQRKLQDIRETLALDTPRKTISEWGEKQKEQERQIKTFENSPIPEGATHRLGNVFYQIVDLPGIIPSLYAVSTWAFGIWHARETHTDYWIRVTGLEKIHA